MHGAGDPSQVQLHFRAVAGSASKVQLDILPLGSKIEATATKIGNRISALKSLGDEAFKATDIDKSMHLYEEAVGLFEELRSNMDSISYQERQKLAELQAECLCNRSLALSSKQKAKYHRQALKDAKNAIEVSPRFLLAHTRKEGALLALGLGAEATEAQAVHDHLAQSQLKHDAARKVASLSCMNFADLTDGIDPLKQFISKAKFKSFLRSEDKEKAHKIVLREAPAIITHADFCETRGDVLVQVAVLLRLAGIVSDSIKTDPALWQAPWFEDLELKLLAVSQEAQGRGEMDLAERILSTGLGLERYDKSLGAFSCNLGLIVRDRGDAMQAIELFESGAAKGNGDATAELGLALFWGKCGKNAYPQDRVRAAQLFSKIDTPGCLESQPNPYRLNAIAQTKLSIGLAPRLIADGAKLHEGTVQRAVVSESVQCRPAAAELVSHSCLNCGATTGLKHCARCRRVMFCSKTCLTHAWPSHKKECMVKHACEQDDMRCGICLGTKDDPCYFSCLHSFCQKCVKQLKKSGANQCCPLCGANMPASECEFEFWKATALGNRAAETTGQDEAACLHLQEVALKNCIKLDPSCLNAHSRLGESLCRRGELEGGLLAFREILRLKPCDTLANYNIGTILTDRGGSGDLEEAESSLRLSLKYDPDYHKARLNLAKVLYFTGDLEGAVCEYEETLRRAPGIETEYRRFALLINRFRWEDADAARARGRTVERVQSLLVVDHVLGVASQGIDRTDPDMILSLLSVEFEAAEDGSGQVILTVPDSPGGSGIHLRVADTWSLSHMLVSHPLPGPGRHSGLP